MGHVPHLHLPGPWAGPHLSLAEGQRHHLERVLRLGDGDPVSYTDGRGVRGEGRLSQTGVERRHEESMPRRTSVTLAVAPPTEKSRARFVVEKLAELGVARLVWIRTLRTEGRPPPPARARAWAEAALEQSRGAWLMGISSGSIQTLERPLVAAHPEGAPRWPDGCTTVVIGPEGGFDDGELADDVGRVSLGPTVLRVETAAVVAATRAIGWQ